MRSASLSTPIRTKSSIVRVKKMAMVSICKKKSLASVRSEVMSCYLFAFKNISKVQQLQGLQSGHDANSLIQQRVVKRYVDIRRHWRLSVTEAMLVLNTLNNRLRITTLQKVWAFRAWSRHWLLNWAQIRCLWRVYIHGTEGASRIASRHEERFIRVVR